MHCASARLNVDAGGSQHIHTDNDVVGCIRLMGNNSYKQSKDTLGCSLLREHDIGKVDVAVMDDWS